MPHITIICPCSKPVETYFVLKDRKKYCSNKCKYQYKTVPAPGMANIIRVLKARVTGKPQPLSQRIKISKANSGAKHWNWQGGKTKELIRDRFTLKAKMWRKLIFERDNYTCQNCKAHSGNGKRVTLNADHIKPWALFPELRYKLSNGRTLCVPCHRKTDTYGYKAIKKRFLN